MVKSTQGNRRTGLIRLGEKFSSLGIVVATLACASCFPALAGIGAALGMGVLSQWEGVFIEIVIPALAVLSLVFQVFAGINHKRWGRVALGCVGPLMILLAFVLFSFDSRLIYLFYLALGLMVVVSIWDILYPPRVGCAEECCPQE